MQKPILQIGIGDLHGHLKALFTLLGSLQKEVGIFEPGQEKTLLPHVQLTFTGDYVDRGKESKGVMETIMDLQNANPHNVECLMGNHELLALADLHNAKALLNMEDEDGELLHFYKWTNHGANGGIAFIKNFGNTDREAIENYLHAMDRDQPLGAWIRNLKPFVLREAHGKKTLYVHGGIPENLRNPRKLEDLAEEYRKHMETRTGTLQKYSEKYGPKNPLVGKNSPFWDRSFPNIGPKEAAEITDSLEVDYIVIGHTPQRDGVAANYGNKIFNIDVGMCPTYGENAPSAIVINEKGPHILQIGKGLQPLLKSPKKTQPQGPEPDL